MRSDGFGIGHTGGRGEDAAPVHTEVHQGERTIAKVRVLAPHALLSAPGDSQERWFVLVAGSGVRMETAPEEAVRPGALWRLPPLMLLRLKAGACGAKLVEFAAHPASMRSLGYHQLGELPPDIC